MPGDQGPPGGLGKHVSTRRYDAEASIDPQ